MIVKQTIQRRLVRRRISWQSLSFSTLTGGNNIYRGVFPILVTPFQDNTDESIDFESFHRTLNFMAEAGVAGVTIAGVLGESNRMTDRERQTLIEAAVNFRQTTLCSSQNKNGEQSLKLCVGATHTGTAATVALSQMAAALGADGVMISPSKDSFGQAQPSDDDIFELYDRVSQACPNLSIIMQDLPSQSGVHMSMDLLVRIATQVPTVHSIKLESLPTVNRLVALEANADFRASGCTILTGLGALYAGFDL
jgi:4-hydroxy-tetrahydrodipicolinate synthase